jgi:hypothetical protein
MTVECARCKAPNPDGKRFCGDCGAPLESAVTAAKGLVGTELRDQVNEIIREHYKDQKILEIETAQAIASRLLDWAKLLGFFIGIPVAVLLLILGVLGISKYSDFSEKVDKAQVDVGTKLADAQNSVAKIQANSTSLANAYDQLSARYENTKAVADKLDAIAKKVDAIDEKLGFTPSSKVSEEIKSKLETAFSKFKLYLNSLGYKGTIDVVNIDIREKIQAGFVAYYDSDKRMMVIDSKYAAIPAVLYREYMHHVLYPGPSMLIDEKFWAYFGIESGLASYFTCSFVDSPSPATDLASWDLTSNRKFTELQSSLAASNRDGMQIWGSAFWEMRKILGRDVVDKLLFDAWFKLKPDEVKTDKGVSFVQKLLELDSAHQAQIRAIFKTRGLTM